MKLGHIAIILGTFLPLLTANAMEISEKDQLKTMHPVKIRVWEKGHQNLENSSPTISSHISLETDKYYMDVHLYSEILGRFKREQKGKQDPTTCCFAIFNFKTAQEYLGDPKKTYVLYLNTQPMNTLWESLTGVVSVNKWFNFEHDNLIGYVFLENVIYDDGLKIESKECSSLLKDTVEKEKLYFNNTTLLKGLLYAGGIKKIQHQIKRFKNTAGTGWVLITPMKESIEIGSKLS